MWRSVGSSIVEDQTEENDVRTGDEKEDRIRKGNRTEEIVNVSVSTWYHGPNDCI